MPTKRLTTAFWSSTFTALFGLITLILFSTSVGAEGSSPSMVVQPALAVGGSTPSPTATACIQTWNVVYTSNPYQHSELVGVDALSSTDVWAVGPGMINHWNGTAWTTLTNTVPLTQSTILFDVAAVSVNDVWVVGRGDGAGHNEAVILHWNGSLWSHIPNPDPTIESGLYGVEAISANDVWAVGYQGDFSAGQPLTMRWDGSAWSIVPIPPLPTGSYQLLDTTATATNDVWATGWFNSNSLIMHWDGSAWTVSQDTFPGAIWGVAAISPNDAWAVVSTPSNTSNFLHWDGTNWTTRLTVSGVAFYSMDATTTNNVWAVGMSNTSTRTMHWNGSEWQDVASPRPYPYAGELWGVAAISPIDVWAVGSAGFGSGSTTVTIRYTQWCPTPISCATGWNAIDGPSPSPDINRIEGIDALAPNDIWAVGAFAMQNGGTYSEHWNGSFWTPILVPGVSPVTVLHDVVALATNNVWAVGTSEEPNRSTIIVHWDGQSWSIVPSPNPGTGIGGSELFAVDGTSANDLWAVGSYRDVSNVYRALIVHWNGSVWSQVTPSAGRLYGIVALNANDVWAVGGGNTALIMHWNGTEWATVPSPSPGTSQNYLNAVSAVSANDIWAVGNASDSPSSHSALTMHWDGTQWSSVAAQGAIDLQGVSARATNDVWAVGIDYDSAQASILHWDGSTWVSVQHPEPGPDQVSELYDVVATSSNEVWAVGSIGHYYLQARIERFVESCQTATPTIASTQTAISTPTASTTTIATLTSTPTNCTIQFADVPPSHAFYAGVRCLACRGILNGYPCGGTGEPCNPSNEPYFRPNSLVTRGQIAKIVSQSAGFSEPTTGQTFQDVPPGSTFYTYTERLAFHTVMSGYPCGGAGEPCGVSNMPYFRPNSTATRGQLTKIVANAEGLANTIPAGQQTFSDVPEGSTYYLYVERLVINTPGVMSGYPCGGQGEPCDPQQRPYFRSSNALTRGQTAKITANSFFPSCTP